MARIQAYMPVIATRTVSNGTSAFSAGDTIGKMISAQIAPTFSNVELYADDELAEYDRSFIEAAVTLGVSTIPSAVVEKMFGVEQTAAVTTPPESVAPETIAYGKTDASPYVGFGFITGEVVDGTKSYKVTWHPKVRFNLPSETYTTRGKNVAFSTPSITGVAEADEGSADHWKFEYFFSASADAVTKLKALAAIS